MPVPAGEPLAVLAAYEAAVSGLRASLVDVDGSPSYLMLTAGNLEGETHRQFNEIATHSVDLWPLLAAVGSALAEAREASERSFGRGQDELKRALGTRWVEVVGGSFPSGRLFSIAEAIELFRQRFDAIRDGVALVDKRWLQLLPRLDAAKQTLARLEGEAKTLSIREPLIGRARLLTNDLEQRLLADPLGIAEGDAANLDQVVAEAAGQMSKLRAGHDRLADDLASTEAALGELRVLRARAAANRAEALVRIKSPSGLVHTPGPSIIDGPGGLAEQLDGLFDGASAWTQRRTLLDGWLRSAERLRTQLLRAEAANQAPLGGRDELRGRLVAYRAKMAAVGRGEDLALAEIADEARTELFTAPVDLERADQLIDQLAEALRT